MASFGPFNPSGVRLDNSAGVSTWITPLNVKFSDNTHAFSSGLGIQPFTSIYLIADDFQDFNIDPGDGISGILVEIEKRGGSQSNIWDSQIKLTKGGTIQSTNKASGDIWSSTEFTRGYGGSTDLWGTTWNPQDINASGFGVAVLISGVLTGGQAASGTIDHIKMTVWSFPFEPIGMTGIGLVSSAAALDIRAASSPVGTATLGSAAKNTTDTTVSILGIGLLTAVGIQSHYGASALTGVGTLEARTAPFGEASFSGIASLLADPSMLWYGATSLTGIGSLATEPNATWAALSALTGVGTLAAAGGTYRSGSVDLFVPSHDTSSGILNLFLHAGTFTQTSNAFNLFTHASTSGISGVFSAFDAYVHNGSDHSALDLFLLGASSDVKTKVLDLYTYGAAYTAGASLDLYVGTTGSTSSLNLFVEGLRLSIGYDPFHPSDGFIPYTGSLDLYIQRNENAFLNLFLMNSIDTGVLNLYTIGAIVVTSGLDLYTLGLAPINKSLNLYSHGSTI